MTRSLPRFLLLSLLWCSPCFLQAEKVADLPNPTTYVNDFAQVLSPETRQSVEDLCLRVHQKANAEVVVVTLKSLDDGQSVEEFTVQLEEKWKLGKKGEDRSALLVLILNPHKLRVETGYGLEGILNDAKVGAILDQAVPFARTGDYDQAIMISVQGLVDVIATDAHVDVSIPTVHHYHREQAPPAGLGLGQIILGVGFVLVLILLVSTGHIGWAWLLLSSLMGGGGGGRGGRDGDGGGFGGGGFGGSGGGESGGGGASRDF